MSITKSVNSTRFSNRHNLGKSGEKKAIEFFNKRGLNYVDVSNIHEYQIIDVDFLVNVSGDMEMLETKTFKDMIINKKQIMVKYKTEYVDEKMKSKKGSDAWLYRTKAKYIMFVCNTSSMIIIITLDALKEYIEQYKDTDYIIKRKFFDEDKENFGKYDRYNYVYYISIKHLSEKVNVNNREKVKIYTDLMDK